MFTKKDREDTKKILEHLEKQQEEILVLRGLIDKMLSHIEKARASKKAIVPKQDDK